jgi:hypothetical protein
VRQLRIRLDEERFAAVLFGQPALHPAVSSVCVSSVMVLWSSQVLLKEPSRLLPLTYPRAHLILSPSAHLVRHASAPPTAPLRCRLRSLTTWWTRWTMTSRYVLRGPRRRVVCVGHSSYSLSSLCFACILNRAFIDIEHPLPSTYVT